jgi:hypothetical protein
MNNIRTPGKPAPVQQPANTANKPVHSIRLGPVKAAIWANAVGEATRYNVSLCRIYKDGESWKTTESYGRDDLLLLSKVADLAHTWICDQQSAN